MQELVKQIVQQLLESPPSQLDDCIKLHMKDNWVDLKPTALQVLNVLDRIVRYSLASDFVVNIFNKLLLIQIDEECTTMEDVISQAKFAGVYGITRVY